MCEKEYYSFPEIIPMLQQGLEFSRRMDDCRLYAIDWAVLYYNKKTGNASIKIEDLLAHDWYVIENKD